MTEPNRPQNSTRRRLAKGALVTPAVLASLTTRNALAGNYACSTSGKLSMKANPNTSHRHDQDSCHNVGLSCEQWKNNCRGSAVKVVDCLGIDYKGKTDKSDRVTKLKRANYTRPASGRGRGSDSGSGWSSCTLDQMFNGEDDSEFPLEDRELVWAGLCAYLNAEKFGRQYHITTTDARALFLGAQGQRPMQKNGKTWTDEECREHLMMLWF